MSEAKLNVYSYLDLELTDRGWVKGANGQSVFYNHENSEFTLEPLHTGKINVLNEDHQEVGMIVEISDIMKDKAKEIVSIIKGVDTDHRGNLYAEVANQLNLKGQGYTAKLFQEMAEEYGVNPFVNIDEL